MSSCPVPRCADVCAERRWADDRGRLARHPFEPSVHVPPVRAVVAVCWCGAEEDHRIHFSMTKESARG